MSTTARLPEPPQSHSLDPLATGCTPSELAAIEAAKGKPAVQPQPVRWGPLDKASLLALRYLGQADERAQQRISDLAAEERQESDARYAELIEAVAGRAPPLLEGHDLTFRTEKATGHVYLVATPAQKA